MIDMKVIVWLFPILFIFHDFEEIIFMKPWVTKNRQYLSKRFPILSKKLLSHFDNISTSAFVLGVAEEFVLISIVTVISFTRNWFFLWVGLFIAFALHLIIHCIQTIIFRRYVPAIITSIICLPICIYFIQNIMQLFPLGTIILYSIISFILMVGNLVFMHKVMVRFNKWLSKFYSE
ncbi:MAG: HXXEE domain-containing protein [Mobilitalea sp.]